MNITLEGIFKVVQIIFQELSICFHSKYTDRLSKFMYNNLTSLFVLSLINPFRWLHPLIVILPQSL